MYHIVLQFFGADPHVPKPCQPNGITLATAYWNIAANCHETPPIPAAEYESFYLRLPDKWRVKVIAGEIPVKQEPAPLDISPEPAVIAEAPKEPAAPEEAQPAKPTFRQLRALCKERGIPVPSNATIEELQALLAPPAPPANAV